MLYRTCSKFKWKYTGMDNRLCTLRAALLLLAFQFYLSDGVIFKLTNIVCASQNDSILTIHECRLRAISRNKTILNVNASLNFIVHSGQVSGQLYKKANGYKPWLYGTTIDGCRFAQRPYHPVAIIVYRFLKEFSNFNHTCPYYGPILVRGLYLNLEKLPHVIPTGDYLLTLDFKFFNKSQASAKVYFQFVEDLI